MAKRCGNTTKQHYHSRGFSVLTKSIFIGLYFLWLRVAIINGFFLLLMQTFVNSNREHPINFDVFSKQFVKWCYNPVNILMLVMDRVLTTRWLSTVNMKKKNLGWNSTIIPVESILFCLQHLRADCMQQENYFAGIKMLGFNWTILFLTHCNKQEVFGFLCIWYSFNKMSRIWH